ncbi:MAG: hypothetical protein FWH18_06265 [Marinilabiliaceae bacterium]|nr:hypothetical protein [Marinilabiliaceae bacterium]
MKNLIKIKMLSIILLICGGCIIGGCKNPDENVDNEEISIETRILEKTKWKLVGIVDEQGDMKILEPKDCDECYTLTFDSSSTFLSFSSANQIEGTYVVDYETKEMRITEFKGTEINERGDGQLFCNLFYSVKSFILQENELRLYCNEKKNYLLFKIQQF